MTWLKYDMIIYNRVKSTDVLSQEGAFSIIIA